MLTLLLVTIEIDSITGFELGAVHNTYFYYKSQEFYVMIDNLLTMVVLPD